MLKIELMLDSGVFSAWNKGEPELDLKTYIRFIKKHKALLFSYVNMDSIPGVFGAKRTPKDVEKSAKKSYDNLQIMKSHGLKPIPVFHQDEEWKWFERYLKDGETYIGVSSGKDGQGDAKRRWLQRVFEMVSNSKGKPLIHVHGFGITRGLFLLQFPWYSVDSTTWSITAAFGKILIPSWDSRGEKYNYHLPPVGIAVSGVPNKANNATQFEAEAFFKRTGIRETHIRNFIEKEVGTTIQACRYTLLARQRAILVYYVNLMKNLPDITTPKGTGGFFQTPPDKLIKKTVRHRKMRVMFATLMNYTACHNLMNEVGATTRLLSYYDLKGNDEKLEEFVRTGTIAVSKSKRITYNDNTQRLNLIRHIGRQSEEEE